jgi:hypothetical protein
MVWRITLQYTDDAGAVCRGYLELLAHDAFDRDDAIKALGIPLDRFVESEIVANYRVGSVCGNK